MQNLKMRRPFPDKAVYITFDDGNANNYIHAFPVATHLPSALNIFASLFCVTGTTTSKLKKHVQANDYIGAFLGRCGAVTAKIDQLGLPRLPI